MNPKTVTLNAIYIPFSQRKEGFKSYLLYFGK